jgi:hypothetical protein
MSALKDRSEHDQPAAAFVQFIPSSSHSYRILHNDDRRTESRVSSETFWSVIPW